VDEVSLSPEAAGGQDRAEGFRRYIASLDAELSAPLALADAAAAYDAIVLPGGHGRRRSPGGGERCRRVIAGREPAPPGLPGSHAPRHKAHP
jgi:hypothetical protein